MIKHVGKHGDRKVAIIFREIPGEDHMCLVVYPDTLQQNMHNTLMAAIESNEAQQAEALGDALGSKRFGDGTVILNRLHGEGMMKKVQTAQVTVTPSPQSHVRLDEMNRIINEMKTGEDAIKRLAELDANSGYNGKASRRDDYGREVGAPADIAPGSLNETSNPRTRPQPMQAHSNGALDDTSIANNLKAQADRMATEAASLIAESQRMQKEASEMLGEPVKATKAKAKTAESTLPKKRGRPSKKAATA
jgi:hypothetical protein